MIQIFVDTNLFIRYFTNDIPSQAERVEKLFLKAERGEAKLSTNELIIAEIVWVLEAVYNVEKAVICDIVQAMLNMRNLEIPNKSYINEAAEIYKDKNIDFIDAYTVCYMKGKSIKKLASFDKKHMKRIGWIELEEM